MLTLGAVRPYPAFARGGGGFTLIELLVGIAILAIVLAFAAPGFADAMRNSQIRGTAESLQSGLEFARAEAVRRNTTVWVHLVDKLDNTCALSSTGPFWVVNTGGVDPSGACGSAVNDSATPFFLQVSPTITTNSTATLATDVGGTAATSIAFDGLGRQVAATSPATVVGLFRVQVQSSTGTCMATAGGTARCLDVRASPAGQVRLCDPSLSSSTANSTAC